MRFTDRRQAGMELAEKIATDVGARLGEPLVVALSPGGVVVAAEVARRLRSPFAVGMPGEGVTVPPETRGHPVVLVDDGLTSAVGARAAARRFRLAGAVRIVLATPVCAPRAAAVQPAVDDLVCLGRPWYFRSVGDWYDDFHSLSDHEVTAALSKALPAAAC